MSLYSDLLNLPNTGSPVGSKNKGKNFGNKVVKFFTFHRIGEFLAVRTTGKSVFRAALSDFAPSCLFVVITSRASLL